MISVQIRALLWRLNNVFKIVFFILPFAIFYVSAMPQVHVPVFFRHSDKLFHFIEYFALALAGFFAFRNVRGFRWRLLIFGVIFAIFDEVHQASVPGRVADYGDVIADVLPFFCLWLIRFPLPCPTISVKGRYCMPVFELVRSVLTDTTVSIDGAGMLTVWVLPDRIRYFYEGSMLLETKIKKMSVKSAKLTVYNDLEFLLDKNLSAWGVLYQVRPGKVLDYMHGTNDERKSELQSVYAVSAQKADLLLEIETIQKPILHPLDGTAGVYIGVPFCPSKCSYCSFTSYPIEKFKRYYHAYCEALQKELHERLSKNTYAVSMVYIGGGTPFTLHTDDLENVLKIIQQYCGENFTEYTCEAGRPELFTHEKLSLLRRYGVSRIAINPQTMHTTTLQRIGRLHTKEDFYDAYQKAVSHGFEVINADCILGLPGESRHAMNSTVDELCALEHINSITIHALAPKKGAREKVHFDEKILNAVYSDIDKKLRRNGFTPYYLYRQRHIAGNTDNIGYARHNAYSLYNISMIGEHHTILGFGPGASTKYVIDKKVTTVRNAKDLSLYITHMSQDKLHDDVFYTQGGQHAVSGTD